MEIRDKKVNKIHIGEKFKIHDCERDSRTLVVRSEEEDEESITDGDTAAYKRPRYTERSQDKTIKKRDAHEHGDEDGDTYNNRFGEEI